MAHMTTRKCKCCKVEFQARTADVNRGWAKFCSKSCKAKKQEQRTGQYSNMIHNTKRRHYEKEYGGIACFDHRGEYVGFMAGGFDNTANQDHGDK